MPFSNDVKKALENLFSKLSHLDLVKENFVEKFCNFVDCITIKYMIDQHAPLVKLTRR